METKLVMENTDKLFEEIDNESMKDLLSYLIDAISKNKTEYKMFCHRWGLAGYEQLKCNEIAEKYDVSSENVSYITCKVKDKLRNFVLRYPSMFDEFI